MRRKNVALKLGCLVTALILLTAGSVRAQSFEASPFQLANLAYEGYLTEAGVPGRGRLVRLYNRYDVRAIDVVAAGIAAGYIPESRREDRQYINAVAAQMVVLRDRDRRYDWRR